MLKMFSTQTIGLFKRISEKAGDAIEDGARLLAQAAVGEGSIVIHGIKEMSAVSAEALEGEEPLKSAKRWDGKVAEADRALIVARFSTDPEACDAAKHLVQKGIPFAAVSTKVDSEEDDLSSLADVHIDLKLSKGLLPAEDGSRYAFPSAMAALFVYHALKFTIDEMLAEYE